MNRIMGRAKILLILILILTLGTSFFLGEYIMGATSWIFSAGSPHLYQGGNLGCGIVTDRNGVLLMDQTEGKVYAPNEALRKATLHWLGDREGNISAPALANYAKEMAGFDPISGVYAYGGVGGTMTTSLCAEVQIAALEALGDYKGTVALYNYKTGEIICAVSTPTYDPDNVPDISGDTTGAYTGVYMNRLIQSTYTPGSIFKIATVAAALEHIPNIREQTFTCSGIVEYGIDKVTCEQSHGVLTFDQAFGRSCNCAFSQIADQLGGQVLERYVRQFQILESLEFDGISTAKGFIQANGQADVSVAWSAIGQHKDLINPCSYMAFLGAIANDGVASAPHIVSQVQVGSKVTYRAQKGQGERIMSSETAQYLAQLLRNNVATYYGDSNFPGLKVCAKSGTAEVGPNRRPNAMFTGFLADEDLPLAFIVSVEDAGYGRPTCVPILSQILSVCKEVLAP